MEYDYRRCRTIVTIVAAAPGGRRVDALVSARTQAKETIQSADITTGAECDIYSCSVRWSRRSNFVELSRLLPYVMVMMSNLVWFYRSCASRPRRYRTRDGSVAAVMRSTTVRSSLVWTGGPHPSESRMRHDFGTTGWAALIAMTTSGLPVVEV
jgi:hypothetical protein